MSERWLFDAKHKKVVASDMQLATTLDLFHCFDRISRRGVHQPFRGGQPGSRGVQSERKGRPNKSEFVIQKPAGFQAQW